MVDNFKSFTRGFTIFSVTILLVSLAVYLWIPTVKITNAFPYIVLFFYAFTLFIFRLLFKTKEHRVSKFANTFMIVNFGKLVIYAIIIFVYAYLNRSDAISFIITFFIYYILFTSYEVMALLKK